MSRGQHSVEVSTVATVPWESTGPSLCVFMFSWCLCVFFLGSLASFRSSKTSMFESLLTLHQLNV